MIKYITEFLVVLSLVVNTIQFLIFSLMGIDYDPETGTGLVAILNVSFFAINIVWVLWHELTIKAKKHIIWPYVLIGFIIFTFFLESAIYPEITLESFPGKQFTFFGVMAVPAIMLATYVYRHNAYDMIARNMDIIMLICSLALILNVPNMMSDSGFQTIGGAGGHQDISYSAAWCACINFTNILSGNQENRFSVFNTKIFRIIFWALLPIQAMICVLGGGRGGGVLLVLGFLIVLYIYGRQRFWRTVMIAIFVIGIFAIVATYSGQFSDGFGRTFNYLTSSGVDLEQDMSDIERTHLREKSYGIIGESPIWGYGLWYGLIVAGFYMHNVFLDILISGGILYLIFFLFMMKRTISTIGRMVKESSQCTLLPIALLPGIMLLFSGYYMVSSLFWFSIIYALLNYKFYKK